jgi:hypothetical protein
MAAAKQDEVSLPGLMIRTFHGNFTSQTSLFSISINAAQLPATTPVAKHHQSSTPSKMFYPTILSFLLSEAILYVHFDEYTTSHNIYIHLLLSPIITAGIFTVYQAFQLPARRISFAVSDRGRSSSQSGMGGTERRSSVPPLIPERRSSVGWELERSRTF